MLPIGKQWKAWAMYLLYICKRRDRQGRGCEDSMNSRTVLGSLLAATFLLGGAAAEDEQESKSLVAIPERIQFNRDIRPILSENCVKCHGPAAQARKGNLRLD